MVCEHRPDSSAFGIRGEKAGHRGSVVNVPTSSYISPGAVVLSLHNAACCSSSYSTSGLFFVLSLLQLSNFPAHQTRTIVKHE